MDPSLYSLYTSSLYGQPLLEKKKCCVVPTDTDCENIKKYQKMLKEAKQKKCQDCISLNALYEFNEYLRATGQSKQDYIEKYGTKKRINEVKKS